MASRYIHLLLAALVAQMLPALGCRTDTDCSLNGVCNTAKSTCVCDPGWIASDCSALDVRPAKRISGYNRTGEGISSWCNRIVHDPVDHGLFHLFISEFSHHCGLDYWSPYSRVIRAESRTGPQGPYTFAAEVVGSFAHNPTVIWSPADKKYLLYYIGCPQVLNDTCTGPSFTCGPGNYVNGESGISVVSSPNLIDWTFEGQVFMGDDTDAWDADITNPSAFPLYSAHNKTDAMLLIYRGCPENCGGYEYINAASSSFGFRGPYTKSSLDPFFDNTNEDPFVWRDKRGNWHMLLHSTEAGGGFGDGPKVGRHAYAKNWAGPWTFVSATLAYNTTVSYDDGTVVDFYRRERPQLFFSEDGNMTPLFLSTGVQERDSPQSYSVIVPVGREGLVYGA